MKYYDTNNFNFLTKDVSLAIKNILPPDADKSWLQKDESNRLRDATGKVSFKSFFNNTTSIFYNFKRPVCRKFIISLLYRNFFYLLLRCKTR